jgi:protein MAK16
MQNDAVIWDIINHSFCSFKTKVARERTFCQNEFNVTGLCIRSACPLANSAYATIREEDGQVYLYQKTAERAHTPKYLWEKIKLPPNYTAALELLSKELEHYPKYLQHRNKQRLTKIHQMLIRMRRLKLKSGAPKLMTINTKVERREVGKERKALKAAQLDRSIENELLERLKQVNEGEIYNFPHREYSNALSRANNSYKDSGEAEKEEDIDGEYDDEEEIEEEEEDEEVEYEEELEEEEEEEEGQYTVEYVEDFDESDDEEVDVEDTAETISVEQLASKKRKSASTNSSKSKGSKKSSRNKGPRIEIEYENEDEGERRQRIKM